MKLTHTLAAALTAASLIMVGCEDKKAPVPHDHDGDGIPDHGPGAHKKVVPHDHDGDGIPDHGPGAHPAPVPHDHDGDGKPDHGPGAHDDKPSDHSGAEADHGHDHDHDHAKVAGPNGGRIITAIEPHAEFLVTTDNKVRITFLDENNQAQPVAGQSVSIVGGDRSNPTTLTLVKTEDGSALLSTGTLPEGNLYPIIVTFTASPDAAPVLAKFSMNLSDCPTCDYKEYACTCAH